MRDPYTVLGVTAEVSDDELRSVYLRLAQQNHPDRNQGREEAGARMKEINAAYEQILDWRKGKNIHTGFSPEGEALSADGSTFSGVHKRMAHGFYIVAVVLLIQLLVSSFYYWQIWRNLATDELHKGGHSAVLAQKTEDGPQEQKPFRERQEAGRGRR